VHRKELACLFNWSKKHMGLPDINPCTGLEKMPEEKKVKLIPTYQEFLRMLAATSGDDRNLLVLLAYTMGRIDEILRLTWQDVNFERQTITLWTRKNKSGEWKHRIISMNEDSKSVLTGMWNRRKQEKWVFFNKKEQDRFNRRPKFMRSVCKRAGIPFYGFHCITDFRAGFVDNKIAPILLTMTTRTECPQGLRLWGPLNTLHFC